MTDVCLCPATPATCPLTQTCYRAQAKGNPDWQTWFLSVPYDDAKGKCAYYMRVNGKDLTQPPADAGARKEPQ